MPKTNIDWKKCNRGGTCVDACPVLVFELQDRVSSCPTGSITVEE
jgi:NAD-dependent dihydropyrimidine dehydrogenase PreA subunit